MTPSTDETYPPSSPAVPVPTAVVPLSSPFSHSSTAGADYVTPDLATLVPDVERVEKPWGHEQIFSVPASGQ